MVFIARSASPPSVFSIARENPSVVQHEPERQEEVAPADISGVDDALVVTNAYLEGLAPGLEAKQLLVANEDQSFSVILSAPANEIDTLWEDFMNSVRITRGP